MFCEDYFHEEENYQSDKSTMTMDLSFLARGIYVLEIISDTEKSVKKIVKGY